MAPTTSYVCACAQYCWGGKNTTRLLGQSQGAGQESLGINDLEASDVQHMSKDLGLMETEQGTHLGEQHGESREQDSVIGDTLGKFILINGHEIEHNHSEDANELRDENVPDDSFIRPELEIKLSGGGDDLHEGSPGFSRA
ncbi:hypothetical protein K439DRAFT_1620163 [Ramaria rubella]|nr:hypothetical protein K439DRAFT_1620163 [Ramaria rubella]